MSRHGYDRKAVARLTEVGGMASKAQSLFFYFAPDWDGAGDGNTHGLVAGASGSLKFEIVKEGKSRSKSSPAKAATSSPCPPLC